METGETGLLSRFPWVARRPLTVAEYHRMGEVGILAERDRVELIEGELVAMSPIGSRHAGTVNALNRLIVSAVGERAVVSVQNPIQLDDRTEPEPDIAVLKPRQDDYRQATPRPDDVLLVIEVADTSVEYDRTVKLPLYAGHGIPEVWIVNLVAAEVEVWRTPAGDRYESVLRLGRGATLALAGLSGAVFPIAAVLG